MKRLTALLLDILMLSSLCTAFAENSSDFSYDPGYSWVSESAVNDSNIQGRFTESGYANDYFMLNNVPVKVSANKVSKTMDEIKQYVKGNDFYTLFDDGDTTIAVFKADRYGNAVSESQFLNLFMEKAASYPWSETANSQNDEKRIGESEFNLKYIPTLYLNGIYSFAFMRDGYVLLVSSSDRKVLNSIEYNFYKRIETDVKSWKNIDSVYVNNGYAIGIKTDGSTVTAGMLPYFAEAAREWKNIKKIVSFGDIKLVALTKDGKVLSINSEDYSKNYDVDDETQNYTNISNAIDISMHNGFINGFLYILKADGSVYFDNGNVGSIVEVPAENLNKYLEEGEHAEKLSIGSFYDGSGVFFITNKENLYYQAGMNSGHELEAEKLNAEKVSQLAFTQYRPRALIFARTANDSVYVYDFNNYFIDIIDDPANGIKEIAVCEDHYNTGYQLLLIDSKGSVSLMNIGQDKCIDSGTYDGSGEYIPDYTTSWKIGSVEVPEYTAAYKMSAWNSIRSIKSNGAEQPLFIGIKNDGTAVCAYTQKPAAEESAASDTAVPQREKPFPTDINVDNYVKVTASEVYNEVKRGVDNRIFTRKFVDENRIEVIANPETGTVRRITLLKDSYGSEYDKSFYYDKEGNLVFVLYDSPELSHRMYIYDDVMIFWKETKAGETNSIHHEMENTAKYYEVEQAVLQESEKLLKKLNGTVEIKTEPADEETTEIILPETKDSTAEIDEDKNDGIEAYLTEELNEKEEYETAESQYELRPFGPNTYTIGLEQVINEIPLNGNTSNGKISTKGSAKITADNFSDYFSVYEEIENHNLIVDDLNCYSSSVCYSVKIKDEFADKIKKADVKVELKYYECNGFFEYNFLNLEYVIPQSFVYRGEKSKELELIYPIIDSENDQSLITNCTIPGTNKAIDDSTLGTICKDFMVVSASGTLSFK